MSKIIKAHSLTGRITDGLMLASFKAVKRNRGAAGIDKVSLKMFEANLADNLRALLRDLKSGSFHPHPLRRVLIPKNETEFRPLGIPAVRDRVAQEVVRRLLSPIFEPLFHPASYGFRPGRNCHMALEAVLKLHDEGHRFVLDADIKGFFDNLSHDVIMQAVAERVADGNILRLVEKFLTSGVMDNGLFKPTTIGTPQGGVVTPPTQSQTSNLNRPCLTREVGITLDLLS
jgi:RNA-directed DNA polymerase